jgi:hypothetical protein
MIGSFLKSEMISLISLSVVGQSMILSKNRHPLLGIMVEARARRKARSFAAERSAHNSTWSKGAVVIASPSP